MVGIQYFLEIQVTELLSGVHSGIGSAATYRIHSGPKADFQGGIQLLLHGMGILLLLPAMIAFAVVRKLNEVSQ